MTKNEPNTVDLSAELHAEMTDSGSYVLSWPAGNVDSRQIRVSDNPHDDAPTHAENASSTGRSATITGLDPDRRWYFTVIGVEGRPEMVATRAVHVQGASNVRDIGGYTTATGQKTRWGHVFRADSLSNLTDAGTAYLDHAGIHSVIDFRGPEEIAAAGADRVSARTDVIHIPLLDDSTHAFAAAMTAAIATGNQNIVIDMLGDGKSKEISDSGFVNQISRKMTMDGYADTLRRIAATEGKPILYHCAGGKDRTGMMTAILLGILGVTDEAIVEDFILSNEFNQVVNLQRYAMLESHGIDIELIRPLTEQRPGQIKAALQVIRERYGNWDVFARKCLDISDETVSQLRTVLLTQ